MELLELLSNARPLIRDRIAVIKDDEWQRRTPCAKWSVRDLVTHLIWGEARVAPMLAARDLPSADEIEAGIRERPVEAWNRYSSAADSALAAPGALRSRIEHPEVGAIDGARLAAFRLVDNVIHAWDLAVAVDDDRELDAVVVQATYDLTEPYSDQIPRDGIFDDAVPSDPGADTQTRLLNLFGRHTT